MTFWLQFILVFLCGSVTDAAWAIYIVKTSQKKAVPASIWGGVISLLAAISVLAYTHDHRFLIATVLGAVIGTYLSIKYMNK